MNEFYVMKACVLDEHGGREKLQIRDVPDPVPGPGQVLVRVRAVALNHLDIWVREGLANLKLTYPHILGSDIAGTIEDWGPGVDDLETGARVMLQPAISCERCPACLAGRDNLCRSYAILGENTRGGYAQLIVVPRSSLLPLPGRLGFEEAACIPLTFQTAWQMAVRRAGVGAGQTVLIHGAGSGVTVAAVQICKVLGATVIVTSRSEAKLERILELGADHAIPADRVKVSAEVKKLTGGRGVDVILDHVGAPLWTENLRSVAWGGTIATCGATGGFEVGLDLRQVFFRQITLVGSTMGRKGDLFEVLPLVESGRLRPVLDRLYPLEQAAEAHGRLEAGDQFGKIVLGIDN
jgi:NADPH:quinone reductase-like Zn-dependent oxidoreductase